MHSLFKAVLRVIRIIWTRGNTWVRIALAVVLAYPVILMGLATMDMPPTAISWIAFMLAITGMAGIFFVWVDPILIALIAVFESGRTALRALSTVVAVELFMAFYLAVLPVGSNRVFIPVMGLALLMILFSNFALGKKAEGMLKFIRFVGFATIIVLAILTIPGGEKLQAKISAGWDAFLSSKSTRTEAASRWAKADTLSCGEDAEPIVLSRRRTVRYVVAPSADTSDELIDEEGENAECWTVWFKFPEGIRYNIAVTNNIDMGLHYFNGKRDEWLDYDPLTKRATDDWLSGIQFRNTSERPIGVELTVY